MSQDRRVESYDRGRIEDVGRLKDWLIHKPGMWAFYLHRFTGLVLSFYLVMHLMVLGTGFWLGHEEYTVILQGLESLLIVRLLEIGLFAAFVFHALNGIRIVMFDMTIGLDIQEQLFYLSIALSFATVMAGVPFFLL